MFSSPPPNYAKAERWRALAAPPVTDFSGQLDIFRQSAKGAFVLVGRYDGIDLPNDQCRMMAIDGVPWGTNLLERFTWEYLDLQGDLRSRIATRITQLFGRIIRGRVDHGVFLVCSRALNSWLRNERNTALLPELLQNQLRLGMTVQESLGVVSAERATELTVDVLQRSDGWTNFYARWINATQGNEETIEASRRQQTELAEIAVSWVTYWSRLWLRDSESHVKEARDNLESRLPALAIADNRSAGWLNLWLGSIAWNEGREADATDHFNFARSRLRKELPIPRQAIELAGLSQQEFSNLGTRFLSIFKSGSVSAARYFVSEAVRLDSPDQETSSTNQYDESLRYLGECMGFVATRPDNELGVGPDVLWVDEVEDTLVAFETKVKKAQSTFNKSDIGQSYNHLQ